MTEEIKPNALYTTEETRIVLRVSESTIKRMLKRGLIRANKVGGQYRIFGKEILRLVSPQFKREAEKAYMKVKKQVVNKINKW
ncbi:MAG: helix-turn-helix domain-containing protein [Patescibacteria group bacterium]